MKQTRHRVDRLERPNSAKHFSAIIPRKPYRWNSRGTLVHIKIGSVLHFDTPVCKKDCAFGIVRELRQKLLADRDNLMFLPACLCDLSRYPNVLRLAVHSPKGVARKGSRGGPAPRHDPS